MVVPDPVHPETKDGLFRYGPWEWAEPRKGEHFRRCSYCGSIHPNDLAMEEFWKAEWADRKYGWPHKFYVDIINRDPEQSYLIGMATHPKNSSTERWVQTSDLTEAQQEILGSMNYDSDALWYLFGSRPTHNAKFYTIHLKDPNLDPEVRQRIEQRSGISFKFEDGKIYWNAS